jgi:hypothetical protein
MSRIETRSFQFELPPDWEGEAEGPLVVLTGPRGETVMLRSNAVLGDDPDAFDERVELVLATTKRAAAAALSQAELEVSRHLSELLTDGTVRLWEGRAKAPDGLFVVLIAASRDVLFATYEGPEDEPSLTAYDRFRGSIRPSATEGG